MTEEQKDPIVKGAKELLGSLNTNPRWSVVPWPELAALSDTVRAAEQPRWTVKEIPVPGYNPCRSALCYDGIEQRLDRLDRESLSRFARLLNEDDARGGK